MRLESQTPSQDDHIDRITDYSTRYGQVPVVAVAWDWPREDGSWMHGFVDYIKEVYVSDDLDSLVITSNLQLEMNGKYLLPVIFLIFQPFQRRDHLYTSKSDSDV